MKGVEGMISKSSRPGMRKDLEQADLNDGCVLYDPIREMTYTLNITASLIRSYLDGAFSLEEIAGEVSSIGGPDKDAVLLDIVKTVSFFQENGLLNQDTL
jgi:hypothetical protein